MILKNRAYENTGVISHSPSVSALVEHGKWALTFLFDTFVGFVSTPSLLGKSFCLLNSRALPFNLIVTGAIILCKTVQNLREFHPQRTVLSTLFLPVIIMALIQSATMQLMKCLVYIKEGRTCGNGFKSQLLIEDQTNTRYGFLSILKRVLKTIGF